MTIQRHAQVQEDHVRALGAQTALGFLLLPSAAVVEVVSYAGDAQARPNGPDWLIGELDWREHRVPLVDLAGTPRPTQAQSETGVRRQRPCALVCFTPSGNRALPYIAILVPDSPRMMRIVADDLSPAIDPPSRPFALYDLAYQGTPAWVPDLDMIESKTLSLGLLAS